MDGFVKKGSGTTLTSEQLDAILKRPAIAKVNPDLAGVSPGDKEQSRRNTLDRKVPRKTSRHGRTQRRFAITFYCYSVRPLDWDNWSTKQLQDCLVEVGILADDNWRALEGRVISRKAKTKAEERTEVHIQEIECLKES